MHIIITGASSGLGEGLAFLYAAQGHRLSLLARREEKLQKIAERCRALGAVVKIFVIDITDSSKLQAIAREIAENKIDRIILNAGVSLGHASSITAYNDFQHLFQTNFLSLHAFLEPILPTLINQKKGEIVFISSLASLFTMPSSVAYSTSKRAVNAYAEGLRYQLLDFNIKVMTILPGFIDSEMTQKNTFSMPFFMSTQKGVQRIAKAIEQQKCFYPFPFRFYLIIRIALMLPQPLRDKIVNFRNFNK